MLGIIHCHSKYSYDSVTTIDQLVQFIEKNQLDFFILTDHDSIQGSVELRKELDRRKISNVQVPIAAEYKTEYGDVIAVFINKEINANQSFDDFVNEVRSQGGVILFPHPYKSHTNITKIAKISDLIEVYNSRQHEKYDHKALELQQGIGKNKYWASDAHLITEYKKVICKIEYKNNDLKEALLKGEIAPTVLRKSTTINILISQAIKYWGKRNYIGLFQVIVSIFKSCILINRWYKVVD